jgi:hypothetical protein
MAGKPQKTYVWIMRSGEGELKTENHCRATPHNVDGEAMLLVVRQDGSVDELRPDLPGATDARHLSHMSTIDLVEVSAASQPSSFRPVLASDQWVSSIR